MSASGKKVRAFSQSETQKDSHKQQAKSRKSKAPWL
jgi:hypothetical protein